MLKRATMDSGKRNDANGKSSKGERVLSWRKYIATLNEETFFDIIRIYLGEIKTPFNKQDLVEELSAFLRKEENKQSIINLLSSIDLKLLTAIRFIPSADISKLENFFFPSISRTQISAHIDNLVQRLLIFHAAGEDKKRERLCLNPLLEDKLFDVLDIGILLPSYQATGRRESQRDALDAGKTAAMISYILAHPELSKADGSLKKKNAEELAEKMGDKEQMQVLLNSLRNLGIFTEGEAGKKLIADWCKAESFAQLDSPYQKAYLCAANIGHLSRSSLFESAQLLFDTLQCATDKQYGREALLRLAFLIQQNAGVPELSSESSGRFQKLIAGSSMGMSAPECEKSSIAAALDAAIIFGYVIKEGIDSEGESIYSVNPSFFDRNQDMQETLTDAVKIDAAFTFMIMPGLSLRNLLPLIKFLDLVKYDKVLCFEINKKTAMRSFDIGLTAQKIRETISHYSSYPIPQNLEISIDDWFGSYSSASLYKGYILKVSGENEIRIRKNPFLSSHIVETFAPGLYLLDFTDDAAVQNAINHCGLDFIGKIKTKEPDRSVFSFYSLKENKLMLSYITAEDKKGVADERTLTMDQDEWLDALKDKVNGMPISQDQKDGLISRIDRRVIINEEQLRPESIRFEKLEALGMDYQGKMHVIENANLEKCLVEITSGEDGHIFLGEVTSFTKFEGESEVTLRSEDGTERTFSVSKASLVRKVSRPLLF